MCVYVHGQVPLRGKVSSGGILGTAYVNFRIWWMPPASTAGRWVPLTFPHTFTQAVLLNLVICQCEKWKIVFNCSFDLHFYWVVYLLINKSSLHIKEINPFKYIPVSHWSLSFVVMHRPKTHTSPPLRSDSETPTLCSIPQGGPFFCAGWRFLECLPVCACRQQQSLQHQ